MSLEFKGEIWAEDINWDLLPFSDYFELDKIIQGQHTREEEGKTSNYTNI